MVKTSPSKQGVRVQSLVRDLRSHTPCDQKTKTYKQNQYFNKFNKDFKRGPYLKKNFFFKQRKMLCLRTGTFCRAEIHVFWELI